MEDINNTITPETPIQSTETPITSQLTPKPPKSNIFKYLIFISIFVLLGFIVYFIFIFKNNPSLTNKNSVNNISQTIPTKPEPTANNLNDSFTNNGDKLFISTYNNNSINISIYNPETNKVTMSKIIQLDDSLTSRSTFNSFGSNDSVQYNSKTQEIFLLTTGASEYDGSCINKDRTCLSRIYKIGLNEIKPTVIFESETTPLNWVINSSDNSIILSIFGGSIGEQTQLIKKISEVDGNVIFTKTYPIANGEELTRFVLSKDNNFVYQADIKSTDQKVYNQVLSLHKINNLNGDISYQTVFTGDEINEDTDISPDNNYLAFYSKGQRESNKLYVYELSTSKIKSFPIDQPSNMNLFWSSDSKKLLFWNQDKLNYYDVLTEKSDLVTNNITKENQILSWNSSSYFTYQSNKKINIFDTLNNKVINTLIDATSEIVGINWFQ
jgi:hypothetical protein